MISWIDIETLRVRAGFDEADATHDVQLEAAADQAMSLCEDYCDRWFPKQEQVEQIFPVGGSYMVKRYPIESITAISDANGDVIDLAMVRTVDAAGIILRGGCAIGGAGVWPITVTYVGGFDPLPPSLEFAVLKAFDAVWSSTPGFGSTAGTSSQQPQKISIVGVGSLDFGSSSSSGGGDRFARDVAPWGLLPVEATGALYPYRNHTVIGGG